MTVALFAAAGGVMLRGSGPAAANPAPGIATSGVPTLTIPGGNPTAGSAANTSTAGETAPRAGAGAAVAYGLGDAQGTFARCVNATAACCYGNPATCPPGAIAGYWADPWFKALTTASSAHRIRYVRLFVSVDAVSEWNGSTTAPGCGPSRTLEQPWTDLGTRLHPPGQSLESLLAGLVEARSDGLVPVVSVAGYIPTAEPSYEPAAPDPTTVAGYWDYRCGIDGILGAISRLPAGDQPHIWEAFNEPNAISIYRGESAAQAQSCAVTRDGAPNGPAKAACDYVLGERLIHAFAGHRDDTILAGVFKGMDPVYLADYVAQLRRVLTPAEFPTSWAVHDYSGVTRAFAESSSAPLQAFDANLAHDTGGRAKDLWITETGMLLNARARLGDCPAVGTDAAGSIGACISGNPTTQATDIDAFFALPKAGVQVPITHLFWYQWQGEPNWDSGLTDASGVPRTAWCAFYGSGSCTGSPDASPPA